MYVLFFQYVESWTTKTLRLPDEDTRIVYQSDVLFGVAKIRRAQNRR